MACAGYLVRNNSAVVFAEITDGVLTCTPVARHRAAASTLLVDTNLPRLVPKIMTRMDSFLLPKPKLSRRTSQPEDEEDLEKQDCEESAMRLSGYAIDVVDYHDGSLPFSFFVRTKRVTRHTDSSYTLSPVESLLLAAKDQSTKDEWVKRLTKWNRYGWRDTTQIAATDADCEELEARLTHKSHVVSNQTQWPQSTRRRFYRTTGFAASTSSGNDESCANGDMWFHARVVRAHI